ncbi:MAG: hypothetical protein PVJ39_11020 [Gammaproteobacteria bacterium]|jgi:hypothetical protein
MKTPAFMLLSKVVTVFLIFAPLSAFALDPEFTSQFLVNDCKFKTTGENSYYILEPGRQLYLNNDRCMADGECDELEQLWVTVLHDTHKVMMEFDGKMKTINTRVVEEREMVDGELSEISRNYVAECKNSGDIYYFGEDVDVYDNGEVVSHDGAWLAGKDGASPGIIMPGGAYLVGARYYQEIAPGVALDRSENIAGGEEIEVPAGEFENCVEMEDTSDLAPDEADEKYYCPGVGITIDEDLQLVSIREVQQQK